MLSYGKLWPIHAEPFRCCWLGLSETLVLVLGDDCLLQALLVIGPRLAAPLQTPAPVISAVVARMASERERQAPWLSRDKRQNALGVLLSVVGALGQSLGLVTAKYGLVDDSSALSATVIRMLIFLTWKEPNYGYISTL
jgi:hypothetical protein